MPGAPDGTPRLGVRPASVVILDAPADDDADDPAPDSEEAVDRLVRERAVDAGAGPRFVWYRLRSGDHEQTGLVAEIALDDYARGYIAPHEHTRGDLVERLAERLTTAAASMGAVAVAHAPDARLHRLRQKATAERPLLRLSDGDGVEHTLWVTEDPALLDEVAAVARGLGRLYITDGHHRFAAAARVAAARRRNPPAASTEPPAAPTASTADQWVLATLFPADELRILPFHRVMRRPEGVSTGDLLARLRGQVTVSPLPGPVEPQRPHRFTAYVDGGWYGLRAAASGHGPLDRLDVVVLQRRVLAGVFGITEPRRDARLDHVAGGAAEVRNHCDRHGAVGFMVRPPTMRELMAVADAGLAMPPKSTRFAPKTRSGLFLRRLS